ncbi:MAG: DNA metabolism protein [Lentisphaerae bacterium]|nr:DNA metabolism protein [Lentisphaerota bacterium]
MSLSTYRYDGSFEGLLSAFAEARLEGAAGPVFTPASAVEGGLLWAAREVPVCPASAAALWRDLVSAGGAEAGRTLTSAWLAEEPDLEAALYGYCCLTLERRQCLDAWAAQPAIGAVLAAARRVGHEVHRFQGILRFAETRSGWYYAACEPDHNIIVLLAPHFVGRLGDQRWAIHDCRRDLVVCWDGQELRPGRAPSSSSEGSAVGPALSEAEVATQSQWRRYHRHIAIDSRRNPRLQRRCLPRRYWPYLTEMQG